MCRHFLLSAFRSLQKHKGSAFLNIIGLSIGMASCILILMWARFEIGWDRFHKLTDELYLVATEHDHGTDIGYGWGSPPAVGPAFADQYPEVISATRFTQNYGYILQYGDVLVDQYRGSRFVDPEFLTLFTYPLISGDPETALRDPYSIVLTESLAGRLFGDEDPMGKTITVEYDFAFRVTGVIADPPVNTMLSFESLAPVEFLRELSDNPEYIDTWYNCSFRNYLRLQPGTDIDAFNKKIAGRIKESQPTSNVTPFVFPIRDLNMYSVSGEGGYINTIITVVTIALLVLLIACINFMNMATAQAANRAREVGVRKVVGALRRELVGQFYFESILQSVLAAILALVLVEQLLPMFRELTSYPLRVDYTGDPIFWGSVVAIALVTGLVSGSYPALVLSAFKPAVVLKGTFSAGAKGAWFRRVLVVIQFAVTSVLVICTYIVYQQFQHLQSAGVGYNRENLVRVKMDPELQPRYQAFSSALLEHPDIVEVTRATHSLAGVYWNGSNWEWEGKTTEVNPMVTFLGVGDNWLETYGIELAGGRFYRPGTGHNDREVVINETFADLIGGDTAIGKWIKNPFRDEPAIVIGVVKDFRFKPVSRPMEPIILFYKPDYPQWSAFARISGENIPETVKHIENIYREFNPDRLFELGFVEEEYEGMYRNVHMHGELLRNFAILAVLISCLGLFGLASYMTEQRSKEIGIRKVLGASIAGIVTLLTKEFVRWVLVANLIAWPVAFYLMRKWLEPFNSQVDFSILPYVVSTAAALLIAAIAVSFRAVQAALANPVDAIRYE
jgi:putative ABC transport system permease protein